MQATESNGEGCISTTDTAKDIKSNILDGEITNSKNAAICPICNKSYANKHSLSNHKYRKHSKKQTTDPKVDSYEDIEEFKANLRSDILKLTFLGEQKSKVTADFTCSICYKTYANKHSLSNHKYRYHSNRAVKNKDSTKSKIRANYRDFQISRKKGLDNSLIKLLQIHELFKDMFFHDKDINTAKIQQAAFTILLYSKFKKRKLKEKKLLYELSIANMFEAKHLLREYANRIRKVFININPSEIKNLITNIRNGSTTVHYEELSSDRKPEISSGSEESDSTEIKRRHANYRDISRKPEMSSTSDESDSTEIKRRHTNYRDISRKPEMSSASYHSNRAVKHRYSTKIKRRHTNYRDISRKPEISSGSEQSDSTMDDY